MDFKWYTSLPSSFSLHCSERLPGIKLICTDWVLVLPWYDLCFPELRHCLSVICLLHGRAVLGQWYLPNFLLGISVSVKGEKAYSVSSALKWQYILCVCVSTSAAVAMATSALPASTTISTLLLPLPAKWMRPPGQELNTRPRVEHSPQESLLSALPKPCGQIVSDLASANSAFVCLEGVGWAGLREKYAFHLVLFNQYSIYACFWIRIRHPAFFFPSKKAFLLHQTTKAFPFSFFGHQIFLWFST